MVLEVAWCRGEVLEVSMQVAQCRAQGSVTLPLSRSGKEVISCATARARIASIEAMIG